MGLLRLLFGPPKPPAKPYVDEGVALTKSLIALLDLSDWKAGIPTYTEAEENAIDWEIQNFQRGANRSAQADGSRKMVFHPSIIGGLQRMFASDGLKKLAMRGYLSWESSDDCSEEDDDFPKVEEYPEDWRARVSIYLKAWAINLAPDVLLDLSQLLSLVGYKTEAKKAAEIVAAWFPSYASHYYEGHADPETVQYFRTRALEIIRKI